MTFTSTHRKNSSVPGFGVQYIPGHVEPFIDLVIRDHLPLDGQLLDLGGGGLRFAIPVAAAARSITVVDVDESGLDIETIVRRVNQVEQTRLDAEQLRSAIETVMMDAMEYLKSTSCRFSLISAFRLIHFMSRDEILALTRLIHSRLRASGIMVLSAMCPYILPEGKQKNELFTATVPVTDNDRLFRRFLKSDAAMQLRRQQNLGECVQFVDSTLISQIARDSGFELLVGACPATRIVAGYVLKKTG